MSAARRFATVVLLALPVLVGASPAGAQTESAAVAAEAWYQPNPGGIPLPPESPYPAGTLHVGQDADHETARTYLEVHNPTDLGPVLGGQLTVPLDTTTTDGSMSPDTAQVLVCTTTQAVQPVEGSFDPPPASDCSLGVQAVYSATPRPQLVADLFPLAGVLSRPAVGLVLQPALGTVDTSSWQVVFSAHDRVNPQTPAASVSLSYADRPIATVEPTPSVAPRPTALPPISTPPAVVLPGVVPVATPTSTPAAGPLPSVAPEVPTTVVRRLVVVSHPYRHPEIWFLPLVLLLVVPAVNRALARDVSLS